MNTIFIVLPILTLLMFDLGLALQPADFKLIAERPKPVIIGLVGQIILLPLIAWAIIWISNLGFQISNSDSHLSALFIIGIMLVACSPLIFNNEIIAIPAIIYALMMNLILLAYVGITKITKQ